MTPDGVIQEIYACLIAHTVIRTLMLKAASQANIAPTQISFTATIHLMDDNLVPLGLVEAPRRLRIVESTLKEIAQQRLPKQRVRIQARVVKRARSRFERKKPEHWRVPALELDVTFQEIIAVVPYILSPVPEIPLLPSAKEALDTVTGCKTSGLGTAESSACKTTPALTSCPKAVADVSSPRLQPTEAQTSNIRVRKSRNGRICVIRDP